MHPATELPKELLEIQSKNPAETPLDTHNSLDEEDTKIELLNHPSRFIEAFSRGNKSGKDKGDKGDKMDKHEGMKKKSRSSTNTKIIGGNVANGKKKIQNDQIHNLKLKNSKDTKENSETTESKEETHSESSEESSDINSEEGTHSEEQNSNTEESTNKSEEVNQINRVDPPISEGIDVATQTEISDFQLAKAKFLMHYCMHKNFKGDNNNSNNNNSNLPDSSTMHQVVESSLLLESRTSKCGQRSNIFQPVDFSSHSHVQPQKVSGNTSFDVGERGGGHHGMIRHNKSECLKRTRINYGGSESTRLNRRNSGYTSREGEANNPKKWGFSQDIVVDDSGMLNLSAIQHLRKGSDQYIREGPEIVGKISASRSQINITPGDSKYFIYIYIYKYIYIYI